MEKKIKTKDGRLEVQLFNNGMVEIEMPEARNVSIEIRPANIADVLTPPGAVYHITIYESQEKQKSLNQGYGTAWIMKDGKILKAGDEYHQYMKKLGQ